MLPTLDQLENIDIYRRHFMDAALWQPHVQAVCRKHNLSPYQPVRPGLAGSFPTFIVNERWVVKLFGRLYNGERAFETEMQVNRLLLPSGLAVPTPALVGCGCLFDEGTPWRWPYLIFEYLPGISIGEVYDQVNVKDRFVIASALGRFTRQVQSLPWETTPLFQSGLEGYAQFLREQRAHCVANHRQWQTLPAHLIEQLEDFLLPVESMVDPHIPHGLIHADITRDHILGRLEAGRWETLGLIDFGDARVGNVYYDLVALHLDLFHCDKSLLQTYLDAYDLEDRQQFSHQAMCAALLHEFDVLSLLKSKTDPYHSVATLGDLADIIWGIQGVTFANRSGMMNVDI